MLIPFFQASVCIAYLDLTVKPYAAGQLSESSRDSIPEFSHKHHLLRKPAKSEFQKQKNYKYFM